MFTHPALLRELNQIAELLRRGGEGDRSRRVVQATDGIRKLGWTARGLDHLQALRRAEEPWSQTGFGSEHQRLLGAVDAERASGRLRRHWDKVAELGAMPVREAPLGPRPKSPDLG